ncbi:MAG TPA: ATP-binding protein [Myxococcota bacterium]|nr:ATP-binding protein [Myxococcota bacterium]HRY95326.1 ATP-binding protein [Myxococcota bacterium]HSA20780.1 ATP-binding protein [Myxococcota bacterium]
MIERHLASVLKREALRNPVVVLTGPRQSGKTTLVRACFEDLAYVSLERPDLRRHALADPLGFLAGLPRPVILDEVQRAPALLSYIQVEVDEHASPGRFVLTGSQNLLLMEGVSQTLAGRLALLELLPFSLAEILGQPPLDLSTLGRPAAGGSAGTVPAEGLWETLWRSAYPPVHDRGLDPVRWLGDYYRTYVERDLRDVLKVMDLDAFDRFVRLTAARTAGELSLSSLAEDVGISQPTARHWLTALQAGGLLFLLPPHRENFRKRLRKRPKIHFLDAGLVCYLLGIDSPATLARHPQRGAIFESFVVAEFVKARVHQGREPRLFHWRDATGHEIDLLVEDGPRLVPVEIKSGATVADDMLRSLLWWRSLPGNPHREGVLVTGGAVKGMREGVSLLPWHLG